MENINPAKTYSTHSAFIIMLKNAVHDWASEFVRLIEYEPTWFSEFGCSLIAIVWGIICSLSADYNAKGYELILPLSVIVLGLVRCYVLIHLWYASRVILTSISMLLWIWIFFAVLAHYGIAGQESAWIGIFVMEMLTALKFSIPCAKELRAEYKRRCN